MPLSKLRLALSISLLVGLTVAAACGGSRQADRTPAPAGSTTPSATSAPGGSARLDLAGEQVNTVYGMDGGDFIDGFQTLATGDFNADGRADLLVGAPLADGPENSREDGGEAYVILGGEDGWGTLDLESDPPDVTIFGAAAGDNLGSAVLAVDLNDDGIDDIVVGAPGVTVIGGRNERTDQGRAYVFFGSDGIEGSFDVADDPVPYDFVVTGAEGVSRVGHAMATGDLNGDGTEDLVLGAPFAGRKPGTPPGSPRKEAGEVYVIFGSSDLEDQLDIAFSAPGFMASADQRYAQFGASVATGDVNGDGVDDLIAGAPQMSLDAGEATGIVYVFYGGETLKGRRFVEKGEADVAIAGTSTGDTLGFPLASGDVSGDGIDDVIVGARGGDGPGDGRFQAGEAYVILGSGTLPATIDLSKEQAQAVVYGPGTSSLTPSALAVFDIDDDGTDDLILSSTTAPQDRLGAGVVYVLAGKRLQGAVDLASDEAFSFIGGAADDRVGSAIGAIAGEDAGGIFLVLLASGADGAGDERKDAGEIYIIAASTLTLR